MSTKSISISIVSHGHGSILPALLEDIARLGRTDTEVILTCNVPEALPFREGDFPFDLRVLRNEAVAGFGENHNRAATCARGRYLCIVNPDVRLHADPFPRLLAALADPDVGAVAPVAYDSVGVLQDNARHFPTVGSLLKKALSREWRPEYVPEEEPFEADWIAGLFMMFRTDEFRAAGGFDENYFLYYEDVDLCARLRASGFRVVAEPRARIVHDADRRSWRDPHTALIHLKSMLRFLSSDERRTRVPLGSESRSA